MSETILIRPLADPVLDTLGHDPRSAYPERFWLPTLGPTALLLLRLLAARFDRAPGGFRLDLVETSRCLGLGDREGRNSPVARSLSRLVQFDLARYGDAGGDLAVRRLVPPINRRHVRRLPPSIQAEHDAWVSARLAEPPQSRARANARHVAVVLTTLGDTPDIVEHSLVAAGFEPVLAADAAVWAAAQLPALTGRERPAATLPGDARTGFDPAGRDRPMAA
ncbi:MAG TPA: hypothetical protein VHL53_14545 [Acidimicrobiia bacterium]|nr:hypothetical protein [Acidimicrobiia bacterium]